RREQDVPRQTEGDDPRHRPTATADGPAERARSVRLGRRDAGAESADGVLRAAATGGWSAGRGAAAAEGFCDCPRRRGADRAERGGGGVSGRVTERKYAISACRNHRATLL